MNLEIETFKKRIKHQEAFFANMGYFESSDEIYNPTNPESIYYQKSYFNKILQKEITYNYYPSTSTIINNEIGVYLTFNSTSISLCSFLAYKEFNRRLKYEDMKKYRFYLDPENIENSIQTRLEEIRDILSNQMLELFSKKNWMMIPIHDPRDDY